MKKSTQTGIIYALYTPFSVVAGYALAKEQYINAGLIIFFLMCVEYFSVKLWIAAQTEDMHGAN